MRLQSKAFGQSSISPMSRCSIARGHVPVQRKGPEVLTCAILATFTCSSHACMREAVRHKRLTLPCIWRPHDSSSLLEAMTVPQTRTINLISMRKAPKTVDVKLEFLREK